MSDDGHVDSVRGHGMAQQITRTERGPDSFAQLHAIFVEHLGFAVLLAWCAAVVGALHAPWTRNIRGLIDPMAAPESTWSYLFALPFVLLVAWIAVAFGSELIRRSMVLRSPAVEFALAGAAAFAIFWMAIGRVVTAISLAP